jgi:hypothetical protein
MEFSLESYVNLVGSLVALGYQIVGFDSVEAAKPHLILRHDIDFDPEAAAVMAQAESARGWQAHYFALTRSDFYNLSAPRFRTAVEKLVALGHKVGLHFDASLYSADPKELSEAVNEECAVIEAITGAPADVFSLHRPHPDLLEHTLEVPGRINAYAPGLFQAIGYVSDSRGSWRYGAPDDHPAITARTALQLLTHPIWWTSDPALSPHEKCAAFLAKRGNYLDGEMIRSCSAYLGAKGSREV